MLMAMNELRSIRAVYAQQGGKNTHVGGLTLWQAYFLLYVAWRQLLSKGDFALPDSWLTEICAIDTVYPCSAVALIRYLSVQSAPNPAACTIAGLTIDGKAFLQQNVSTLSNAIQAFGLTAAQINSL